MKTKTVTSLIACLGMMSSYCLSNAAGKFSYDEDYVLEDVFEMMSLKDSKMLSEEEKAEGHDSCYVCNSNWNIYLDGDLKSNEIHFQLLDSTQLTQKNSGEEGIEALIKGIIEIASLFSLEGGDGEEGELNALEYSMPIPSAFPLEYSSDTTSPVASFEGYVCISLSNELLERDLEQEAVHWIDNLRTEVKEVPKEDFSDSKPRLTEVEFHNFWRLMRRRIELKEAMKPLQEVVEAKVQELEADILAIEKIIEFKRSNLDRKWNIQVLARKNLQEDINAFEKDLTFLEEMLKGAKQRLQRYEEEIRGIDQSIDSIFLEAPKEVLASKSEIVLKRSFKVLPFPLSIVTSEFLKSFAPEQLNLFGLNRNSYIRSDKANKIKAHNERKAALQELNQQQREKLLFEKYYTDYNQDDLKRETIEEISTESLEAAYKRREEFLKTVDNKERSKILRKKTKDIIYDYKDRALEKTLPILKAAYQKRKRLLDNACSSPEARKSILSFFWKEVQDELKAYLLPSETPIRVTTQYYRDRQEAFENYVRYQKEGGWIHFGPFVRPSFLTDGDQLKEQAERAHQNYLEDTVQHFKENRDLLKTQKEVDQIVNEIGGFQFPMDEVRERFGSSEKHDQELSKDLEEGVNWHNLVLRVYHQSLHHLLEFENYKHNDENMRGMGLFSEQGKQLGYYIATDINELLIPARLFKEECIKAASYLERIRIRMLPQEELHEEIAYIASLSDEEREVELYDIAGFQKCDPIEDKELLKRAQEQILWQQGVEKRAKEWKEWAQLADSIDAKLACWDELAREGMYTPYNTFRRVNRLREWLDRHPYESWVNNNQPLSSNDTLPAYYLLSPW